MSELSSLGRRADDEPGGVVDLRDDPTAAFPRRRRTGNSSEAQLREVKVFGSPAFRRLWASQAISSLGDWIGIVALTAYANAVAGTTAGALTGVSLVLAARLVPGFFLSPVAGVLADRWDRKKVMVICDIGRAAVLMALPFVMNIPPEGTNAPASELLKLIFASFLLELLTLMWAPAKEASVPNLVPKSFLPSANSLSLAAAYGPILIAAPLFGVLTKTPEWLGFETVSGNEFALMIDGATYLVSALVIATLTIPRRRKSDRLGESTPTSGFSEARAGWRHLKADVQVRTALIGLATGIFGGAMVVPLGAPFSDQVLRAGAGGYSLLLSALGSGAAIGMIALTFIQKRIDGQRYFVLALMAAGVCLFSASVMNSLGAAAALAAGMGLFAGSAYVLGFTSIQVNTSDEMRGRVMATVYTVTRFSVLGALVAAPLLAVLLGNLARELTGGTIELFNADFAIPGVRLVLALGGITMVVGALLSLQSLRHPAKTP